MFFCFSLYNINKDFTELTVETIKRDYCPKCQYYIDKKYIYRDCESGLTIQMGTVKDCKFHTDKEWVCNFKKVENENSINRA